uniref:Uncharacterized protein n=1 Tax=Anguilla anguilla TaxID=7936 RepID=A0A0E9TCR9_ANGAN
MQLNHDSSLHTTLLNHSESNFPYSAKNFNSVFDIFLRQQWLFNTSRHKTCIR